MICPLCKTESSTKRLRTPYWICPNCNLWFQSPMPPKTYEAYHELNEFGESTGHLMSDQEKEINNNLAKWLFAYAKLENCKSLDIGSKYPYLSYCLKNLGTDAYGMDNIKKVPEYAAELGVPMLMQDFENWEPGLEHFGAYKLITLVHMFEHIYDPVKGLKLLRALLREDGRLFIRLPAHDVSGIERDLTDGHYSIHPYVYDLYSLLEVLNQCKDIFVVEYMSNMSGAGQRDIILRPIFKRPTIYAGMIVKNEERDLPIALESVKDVIDGAVILDTGSKDSTYNLLWNYQKTSEKDIIIQEYYDASEFIDNDYKLQNFSKARNKYLELLDETDADFILWLDADDKSLDSHKLSLLRYMDYDVFSLKIAPDLFTQHKMWKNKLGIRYEGAVHEYPTIGGFKCFDTDLRILHNYAPGIGETSNARNLRILQKEVAENPNSRNVFYLAQTLHHGGKYKEAIDVYTKRLEYPKEIYLDEYLFAILYKARCERAIGKIEEAKKTLFSGTAIDSEWAEFWMELAYIEFDSKNYKKCIHFAQLARLCKNKPTPLWRENNKYSDQPLRMITHCALALDEKEEALHFAEKAKEAIGTYDKDWEELLNKLKNPIKRIALIRPGSIGDIIMTMHVVQPLLNKYPGYKIDYYCAEGLHEALGDFIKQSGVDNVYKLEDLNAGLYESTFNLIGYPLNEGYPWTKMKKHLIDYYCDEVKVSRSNPSLVLNTPDKIIDRKYITIHPKSGWSKYKDWPLERWAKVIAALKSVTGVDIIQIGAELDPKVPGADHSYMGAPLMVSIALVANATMHMGVDSFTNHLTGITWMDDNGKLKFIPSIILWGSTQVSAAGYLTNENISLNLNCQPCFREDRPIAGARVDPCPNSHECMNKIEVQKVLTLAIQMWSKFCI